MKNTPITVHPTYKLLTAVTLGLFGTLFGILTESLWVFAFAIAFAVVYPYVLLPLKYQWTITDDQIRAQVGLLSRTTTTVPRSNVTDYSVNQSLGDRLFGIYTVTVNTAGYDTSEVTMWHVSKDAVDAVKWFVDQRQTAQKPS